MGTVGRQPFPPRLLRAAILFVIVWMLAGAAPAFAQVTINVYYPDAASTQGEPLPIAVSVTSPTAVFSVTATAGGRSVALAYNPAGQYWSGSLSLDGLPRGPYVLVIEALNDLGQTARISRAFTYDKLPVLKIVQPVPYQIGQPDIPIKAECIDDGPTCTLTLSLIHI